MKRTVRRGDIYYAKLDPHIGSEQGGTRPVLIPMIQETGSALRSLLLPLRAEYERKRSCRHITI